MILKFITHFVKYTRIISSKLQKEHHYEFYTFYRKELRRKKCRSDPDPELDPDPDPLSRKRILGSGSALKLSGSETLAKTMGNIHIKNNKTTRISKQAPDSDPLIHN